MKKILVSSLCVLIASCSSPACILQEKVADMATNVIVEKLQCKNSKEVLLSMEALMKPLGLCEQKTGSIADAICPMIVSSAVNYIASAAIPSKWQCSAIDAKAQVGAALLDACKKLPVKD